MPRDFGELMVSSVFGICLLTPIATAYRRGSKAFRMVSIDLAVLIACLVLFGVGIDMVHQGFESNPAIGFSLGLVEDGGEILITSLLLWYVTLTKLRGDTTDAYLIDFLRSVVRRYQPGKTWTWRRLRGQPLKRP